jgi:hypothetical protein
MWTASGAYPFCDREGRVPPTDTKSQKATTMTSTTTSRALLEASPFPIDGAETIGRDPRKITAGDFKTAGIALRLAKDAIRAKCLDCVGDSASEVRKCTATGCSLWAFRMTGSLPPELKREVLGDARSAPALSH